MKIILTMKTDNLLQIDVLAKATFTTERRLMSDLETVKHPYLWFEVNVGAFITSEHMLQTH